MQSSDPMACWVHAALLITPGCCFPCHLSSESWELMYAAVVSELIKQGLVPAGKLFILLSANPFKAACGSTYLHWNTEV